MPRVNIFFWKRCKVDLLLGQFNGLRLVMHTGILTPPKIGTAYCMAQQKVSISIFGFSWGFCLCFFCWGNFFIIWWGGKETHLKKRRRALAATTAVAVTLKSKKNSQRPWLFFAWKFNYFKYFSSYFHSIHACFLNNIFHFVFIKYTAVCITWRVQWSLNKTFRK